MTLDHHQQIVEVVRDAAGEPPDSLHLLGLAELPFKKLAFADVLRDHQPHTAPRVFQFVRELVHIKSLAVFFLVLPVAMVTAAPLPFLYMLCERFCIAIGANVADGHGAKFIFGIAVLFGSRFVYLEEPQRFRIEHPHGKWCV